MAHDANGKVPRKPTDLDGRSWKAVLRRTWKEGREDGIMDLAAALTYYGILSIFPAILAMVSIVGLLGTSATETLIDNITELAPGPAREILVGAVENLQGSQGTAGVLFAVGLAVALWSASGYVAAFMRASNAIYDMEEGRPLWRTLGTRVLTTVALLLMLITVAIGVAVTGPLAEEVGDIVGVGSTAVDVWDIAKWPVILAVVVAMFALLYWAAPNVRHPGWRWLTPGAAVGVVVLILASAAFAFYVANFGSYNETYGALGGAVVFLIWLWVSNIAILLGAEFDAEIERGREIAAGHPEDREPFLRAKEPASSD